jgi:quercetin dioxygenase-like cupin family protein
LAGAELCGARGASASQQYVFNRLDFPTGNRPSGVAIADVNGDGRQDLIVVNQGDGTVSVLFWTCRESAVSVPHVHEYDEYLLLVQGCYNIIIMEGQRIPAKAGEEYFVPKGARHGGEPVAGTRTIHAFGGRRAVRVADLSS